MKGLIIIDKYFIEIIMPNSFYINYNRQIHLVDVKQGKKIMLELKLKDLEQQ